MTNWPSGWAWHEGPPMASQYFMMIVGVYATLGVFMILAAREDRPGAIRHLRKALFLDPDDEASRVSLDHLLGGRP